MIQEPTHVVSGGLKSSRRLGCNPSIFKQRLGLHPAYGTHAFTSDCLLHDSTSAHAVTKH